MAIGRPRFALLLVDPNNAYQQVLRTDAEAAAGRVGADLVVQYCERDASRQIQGFYTLLQADQASRPQAIIIIPHRDVVLERGAREAAALGIGLAVLNRVPAILEQVRQEHPKVPVLSVSPDQVDMGRIQGQQIMTLLPKGGRIAYIRGDTTTVSAKERQAGMEELVRKAPVEIHVLDGGWVREQAQKSVMFWLRSMATMNTSVDLIACQNDEMALGARAAADALAAELSRPALQTLPVIGCDGVPSAGQKHVLAGVLTATIVSPSTSGAAVEALAGFYSRGLPPAPKTVLKGRSFPDLATLGARVRAGAAR